MKIEKYLERVNQLCKNKTHAVDIGANVGRVSNILFDMGWTTVTAFEPTPTIFERLVENTKDKNITTHKLGVSNKEGEAHFSINSDTESNQETNQIVSKGFQKKRWNVETIKTVTLDQMNLDQMDFLKIDVEGHEKYVVEGAEQTIKKYKPIIVLEVSFEKKVYDKKISQDHKKALDILLNWGYNIDMKTVHDYVLIPGEVNG